METLTITQSHILELASELAHERMIDNLFADEAITKEEEAYIESEDGTLVYTSLAQDYFNMSYDYYLTMIENTLKQ